MCGIGAEEVVLIFCESKLNFLLLSANKNRDTFWYLSQLSLSDKWLFVGISACEVTRVIVIRIF